jgi:hypothetical protein
MSRHRAAARRAPGLSAALTSPTAFRRTRLCEMPTGERRQSTARRLRRERPACSGRPRALPVGLHLLASRAPEVAKMTISSAPSVTCPIAAAPIGATAISKSTSRVRSRSAFSPARPGPQPPAA